MKQWPYEVKSLTQAEILDHVYTSGWQSFRARLKGLPTEEKLDRLAFWRDMEFGGPGYVRRRCEVQIDNYINALKRGGFLNDKLEVVK
jgi:hypothetical protein